jgi:hypothetical protein
MEEHKAQTEEDVKRLVATDRWLLDSGLVTDSVQQNLLAYGYLSSDRVTDVKIALDVNKKTVGYQVFLSRSDLRRYREFRERLAKGKPVPLWQKLQLLLAMKVLDLKFWFTHGKKFADFPKRLWILGGIIGVALYKNPQFLEWQNLLAIIPIWLLFLYSQRVVDVGVSDVRINIEGNLKKLVTDYIPTYELKIEVLAK